MSKSDTVKLVVLMILLPIAGWMGRGAYDSVQRTQRARALYHEADDLAREDVNDKAVPLLEESLALDPQVFEAWQLLAQCEYDKKNRSRSIAVYERALVFLPHDGRLEQRLADMYALDGRIDDALAHLQRARDLLGPDPDVVHAMERVNRWKIDRDHPRPVQ